MRIFFLCGSMLFFAFFNSSGSEIVKLSKHEKDRILSGEQIIRRVVGPNIKKNTYEAIALLDASANDIANILVDFKSYPEYMPNVDKTEIQSQTDNQTTNEAIVDYVLGLPLGKVKKYRLLLKSEKGIGEFKQSWHLIAWPGLKKEESINDTNGFWHIKDFPEKDGYVLVVYHVYTDPGDVPWGLGWIIDYLTEKRLPRVINALNDRLKKTDR